MGALICCISLVKICFWFNNHFLRDVIIVNLGPAILFKNLNEKIEYLKIRIKNSKDWPEKRWLQRQLKEITKIK